MNKLTIIIALLFFPLASYACDATNDLDEMPDFKNFTAEMFIEAAHNELDKDCNALLDFEEFSTEMKTDKDILKVAKQANVEIDDYIADAFTTYDANDDQNLSISEFIEWVMNQE